MTDQFINAILNTPTTIGVYGSRNTGKSFLTKQFLLNQEKLIFPIWNKIYFFFKHYQDDIFSELKQKFVDNLILMNEFLDFTSLEKQP